LKEGKSWLTMTVANYATGARKDDPRLSVEKLSLDKQAVQPVAIAKPEFYYGRILSEDGSPPGARIRVNFPYTSSVYLDSEGYFKVYFTAEQYEKLKAREVEPNIGIPGYDETGRQIISFHFEFSASRLSRDKAHASVVKIHFRGQ
jgi:hypothetical protein